MACEAAARRFRLAPRRERGRRAGVSPHAMENGDHPAFLSLETRDKEKAAAILDPRCAASRSRRPRRFWWRRRRCHLIPRLSRFAAERRVVKWRSVRKRGRSGFSLASTLPFRALLLGAPHGPPRPLFSR